MLRAGEKPPFCVVAGAQTAGRGQYGRSFWSPRGGLYMSIVVPETAFESEIITEVVAQRLVCVIRQYNPDATVKPINDIMLHGKKIAGVLVERVNDTHGNKFFVIGIGINQKQVEPVPTDLADIVGFLNHKVSVEEIVRAIL